MRIHICLLMLLCAGDMHSASLVRSPQRRHSDETTRMARELVLERIDMIASIGHCRQTFGREKIDLRALRQTAQLITFYDATSAEGNLKFSAVVGKPASPDQTLRALALAVDADAFVLGYFDADQYVRTRHVVLARGYHAQPDPDTGEWRPTTNEEKQGLLLHELLHIVLGKDDDDLNSRELCPLRLLSFCPRSPAPSPQIEAGAPGE